MTTPSDEFSLEIEDGRPGRGQQSYTVPLLGRRTFTVSPRKVEELKLLYPDVDVPAELAKIVEWNAKHPSRRKTSRGVWGHITRWIEDAQRHAVYQKEKAAEDSRRSRFGQ